MPDLYIIKIAVGAQGVAEKKFMWHPEHDMVLKPGVLSEVNIALLPLTEHILSLLPKSMVEEGKEFEIMGLHWRGGEQDTLVPVDYLQEVLKDIYISMFDKFYKAVGQKFPVVLHNITHEAVSAKNEAIESFNYINEVYAELGMENENMEMAMCWILSQYKVGQKTAVTG